MPRGDLVVGVDCSTTAAKAVVWNSSGHAVSQARSTFDLDHPRPNYAEQNPRGLVDRHHRRHQAGGTDGRPGTHRGHFHHPSAGDLRLPGPRRRTAAPGDDLGRHPRHRGGAEVRHPGGAPDHRQAAEPDTCLVQAALARRARAGDVAAHRVCGRCPGFSGEPADRTVPNLLGQRGSAGRGRPVHLRLLRRADHGGRPATATSSRTSWHPARHRLHHRGREPPTGLPPGLPVVAGVGDGQSAATRLRHHRTGHRLSQPRVPASCPARSAAPTPAT